MKYFMKRFNYKNIEAFVFRLWTREVSEEKISEKRKGNFKVDGRFMQKKTWMGFICRNPKKEYWQDWSIILFLMKNRIQKQSS
jgi:hypothetical protein